jgi:hypothetical protein
LYHLGELPKKLLNNAAPGVDGIIASPVVNLISELLRKESDRQIVAEMRVCKIKPVRQCLNYVVY